MSLDRLLAEGIAQLGLAVTPAQQAQLMAYLELMAKWNKVYNLTAVRDKEAMVRQHLLDSLALVPLVRGPRVLDVGSGAGLPGLVLAIVRPELTVVTVDTVQKKIAFQNQVVAELGLSNARPVFARVEQLQDAPFDTITSRAFAELGLFVELSRHLLAPDGEWLAMKGVMPGGEMAALPADIAVLATLPLTVPGLDAERCAVRLRPRATDFA